MIFKILILALAACLVESQQFEYKVTINKKTDRITKRDMAVSLSDLPQIIPIETLNLQSDYAVYNLTDYQDV